MERLAIRIGSENYLNVQDSFYIDKTLFVKDVIDNGIGTVQLITRPRRFGKSLALSTLEYFFTNEKDYGYAFTKRKIYQAGDRYWDMHNKYPVVHLNMKSISGDRGVDIIDKIADQMSLLYRNYSYLLDSDKLIESDKKEISDIINKTASKSLLTFSLSRLTLFLSKHFDQKVILLIDEYDAPIQMSYEENTYQDSILFFRSFYSEALKGNNNLLFAVVTGVVEISKESLFSGLNNLLVCPLDEARYSNYFGFNKEEVESIISYYELDTTYEKLREYYGGYNTANDVEMCNPWSILNFALSKKYKSFWANTGTNHLVFDLLNKHSDVSRIINSLNNDKAVEKFSSNFTYFDLNDNTSALLSYLAELGYLSIKPVDREKNLYNFVLPNKEIEEIFETEILNRYNPEIENILPKFRNALTNGKEEEVASILEEKLLVSLSPFDLNDERNYQNAVTGALSMLCLDYAIENEMASGLGRCDIMLTPKKKCLPGIVIELKHSKAKKQLTPRQLSSLADKALSQIVEKDYASHLKMTGVKEIYAYGLAFCGKKSAAKVKKIEIKN